jgi:hypothetical protein
MELKKKTCSASAYYAQHYIPAIENIKIYKSQLTDYAITYSY